MVPTWQLKHPLNPLCDFTLNTTLWLSLCHCVILNYFHCAMILLDDYERFMSKQITDLVLVGSGTPHFTVSLKVTHSYTNIGKGSLHGEFLDFKYQLIGTSESDDWINIYGKIMHFWYILLEELTRFSSSWHWMIWVYRLLMTRNKPPIH